MSSCYLSLSHWTMSLNDAFLIDMCLYLTGRCLPAPLPDLRFTGWGAHALPGDSAGSIHAAGGH